MHQKLTFKIKGAASICMNCLDRQFPKLTESDCKCQVSQYVWFITLINEKTRDYPLGARDLAGFNRCIQDERRSKSKNIPQQRIQLYKQIQKFFIINISVVLYHRPWGTLRKLSKMTWNYFKSRQNKTSIKIRYIYTHTYTMYISQCWASYSKKLIN